MRHTTKLTAARSVAALAALLQTCCLATGRTDAQHIWKGANNNWTNLFAWSAGYPPTVSDDAQINNGGTARVTNGGNHAHLLTLGTATGDLGWLSVSGTAARLDAAAVDVGNAGVGYVTVESGGRLENAASVHLGLRPNSNGTAEITGQGSTWNNGGRFVVGQLGGAGLIISAGGNLADTGGSLGLFAGSFGAARVTGGQSTWSSAGELSIGDGGQGALTIERGGTVVSYGSYIGRNPGSIGAVNVHGGGSNWDLGTLVVAESGHGELLVNEGGAVGNFGAVIAQSPGSIGKATVDGLTSIWTDSGALNVGDGGSGELHIVRGGKVTSFTGSIGGQSASTPGTGFVKVAGADSTWDSGFSLVVGDLGSGGLFISDGGKVANAFGLLSRTVGSQGSAFVTGAGSQWISNDELAVGAGGFGDLVVSDGGLVASRNGTLGLIPGSEGRATISGVGSKWANVERLKIGELGAGELTVDDGGKVSALLGVSVGVNGKLLGHGVVAGDVTNNGLVSPYLPGALTIDGDLSQSAVGDLVMTVDFSSLAPIAPKLNVLGDVRLDGALEVNAASSVTALGGSRSFDILDWTGALSGTFSSLVLPPLSSPYAWDTSQLYISGVLSIIGPSASADFDQDGVVGGDDFLAWQRGFGVSGTSGIFGGDANGDHHVDAVDLAIWRANFGATAATVSTAAPEPTGAALLGLAIANILCCLRRRPRDRQMLVRRLNISRPYVTSPRMRVHAGLLVILVTASRSASSATATFGAGANNFTIEFVPIGNPGNPADTTGNPRLAGAVSYAFAIGRYEVSRGMVDKANDSGGLAITLYDLSSFGGNGAERPATGISWNEAARFVNWLNTSQGFSPAYKFASQPGDIQYDRKENIVLWSAGDVGFNPANPFRNYQARFFLPTVDEWYKAAYYDPQAGVYYDYPTGGDFAPIPTPSGTAPGTAVYDNQPGPADVTLAGGLSPSGVMGMGGNAYEWEETEYDFANDSHAAPRGVRGGYWGSTVNLRASVRFGDSPTFEAPNNIGFRVVNVPEPRAEAIASIVFAGIVFRRAAHGPR